MLSNVEMPAVTVRSLVGKAQAGLAAVCLGSLLAAVRRPVRLALHDDGTLDNSAREFLGEFLGPNCMVVERAEASDLANERLRAHPRCRRFRNEHLFGAKLFDVPILAGADRAIYVDADILWTRPCDCPAYFTGEGRPAASFVVMRDLKESYAVALRKWPELARHGIRLSSRFCAGMMSFHPAAPGYDLDYIEWLLGIDERVDLFGGFRFWSEQTIYAALAARAGECAWIEPLECLVAHRREFAATRDATIIHFAGFSRGLLESRYRGVDFASFSEMATSSLGARPAPDCGLARRLLSAVRVRLRYHEKAPASAAPNIDLTLLANSLPKRRPPSENSLA